MTYLEYLKESAEKANNNICMGLDPVLDYFPASLGYHIEESIPAFFEKIFDEISNREIQLAAFKPNQGYYLKHDVPLQGDFSGSIALSKTIKLCREYFPHTPIIMDYKRGDIATSSGNYANEGFQRWGCDAVTISPYMGSDSVFPFLKYSKKGQGTYILNRTSNIGGKDLQNLILEDGKQLYHAVEEKIIEWSKEYPGTGAVVGATSISELTDLAKQFAPHDIQLLIPGVGSQGGSAKEVMKALKSSGYDVSLARINSSSGLTHPWKKTGHVPENWAEQSADALEKLIEDAHY